MKVCIRCETEKDEAQFYFDKKAQKSYGCCKVCWQASAKINRLVGENKMERPKTKMELEIEKELISGTRLCKKCKTEKQIENFKKQSHYRYTTCLACNKLDGQNKWNEKRNRNLKNRALKKNPKELTLEAGFKICSGCAEKKDLISFPEMSIRADGFSSKCQSCVELDREKGVRQVKRWYINNKDRAIEYRENNKIQIKERMKKWRADKREYRRIYRKKYNSQKRKNDPKFKILENIRSRIRAALKANSKKSRSRNLIGCSIQDLKIYLESLWTTDMSWENYGRNGWHIDHIIPCDSFNMELESDQRKCFNYKNLTPRWATTKIAIAHGEPVTYIGNIEKSNRIIPHIVSEASGPNTEFVELRTRNIAEI